MPWQAGVAWEASRYAGWAMFAAGGGVLVAQEAIRIPYVQNNAALGVTIAGLATLFIDRYYRDRADARASRVKEIEARNAELEARNEVMEAQVALMEGALRAEAHAPSAPLPIPEPRPEPEPKPEPEA